MDWGNLFFTFSGRINRAKFWIAMFVYTAINIVLAIIGYVTDDNGVFQAVNGMLGIVVFISSVAVGMKRLHDREKSGWYLLLFYIVPSILLVAAIAVGTFMEDSFVMAVILGLIALAFSIWAFVELGCLRGTIGANRYGPDPVGPAPAAPVRPAI